MKATVDFDVLIVGGGMVGASLAIALSGHGLSIGLVDAFEPGDRSQPGYDDRAIALAYGSRRVFESIGIWQGLTQDAEPISKIHVSDRGHFGFSHLSAAEEGVPALGYVVTARRIGQSLVSQLRECPDVCSIAPAEVVALLPGHASAGVRVIEAGEERELRARLLVAADGGRSFIREQLNIPTTRWAYGQSAVVANISSSRPHNNVAYERFTDSGPVALLPMTEGRSALVWTVRDKDVDTVMGLDDMAFLAAFQERFGYRLGRFIKVGKRDSYPLSLLRVRESVRERIAIIGNAAHTLHPIAGQGFNLGLRDVAALVEVVLDAHAAKQDLGSTEALGRYQRWRQDEQRTVALATDGLARLFSNPLGALRLGRNLGLLAIDLLGPARHRLARGAMGLLGRQSRLSRGLPPG